MQMEINKVYVVIQNLYGDISQVEVFSSREVAERYCKKYHMQCIIREKEILTDFYTEEEYNEYVKQTTGSSGKR